MLGGPLICSHFSSGAGLRVGLRLNILPQKDWQIPANAQNNIPSLQQYRRAESAVGTVHAAALLFQPCRYTAFHIGHRTRCSRIGHRTQAQKGNGFATFAEHI